MNIDESRTAKGFTPGSDVPNRTIEEIFIHHWGERGQTHDGVVNFFCSTGPGATSAHFVASAGRVNCIVSPPDVAWHAGVWEHNIKSVGIECRPEATEADYVTVSELIAFIRANHGANLPLVPHKAVHATACPGVWDLAKLDRMARAVTAQGAAKPAPAPAPKPAPKPAPAPAPSTGLSWIVEAGDTLGGIAGYYGISIGALAKANGITNVNALRVGQRLSIPGPLVWIVDPGDTLAEIAAHYGLTVSVLAAKNGIRDVNRLTVGQTIRIL